MTNYQEEQELELEALTSIFEESGEFEKISETEFKLKFKPYPAGEKENHVGVTLRIRYTEQYPEEAPEWELEDVVGLSDPKLEELKSKVEESIESSLGMAMVYTIAEMCQDWLKENNVKALSMHEEMMKRLGGGADEEEAEEDEDDQDEVDALEEEEWKGLKEKVLCPVNERITIESFMEWKKTFDQEMVEKGVLKREENMAKTGRQFFLDAQDAAATDAAAAGGGEAAKDRPLVYDAALFGEEDDDDLDDLSGGEEEKDEFFKDFKKADS